MKNISIAIVLLSASISLYRCKPEEIAPLQLSTTMVGGITATTARSGGFISSGNAASFGVCWSTHENPTVSDDKTNDGAGAGTFVSNLTNLVPHTVYYVRSYATNSEGTVYGEELSFTTLGQAPVVVASTIIRVDETSVILGGTINSNYVPAQVTFEYGPDTKYGSAVPAQPNPVNGSEDTKVVAAISELAKYSLYHFRIRAENAVGVDYGDDVTFTMSGTKGSVTDIEGNTYETIVIGTQNWMAEDLRAVHFNDGTAIPFVDDPYEWSELSTAAYTWLGYNVANKNVYGVYYNWYTVDTQKLCPAGWHVPSRSEWMELDEALGPLAGGKMKTTGLNYWNSPNAGANNSSGFAGKGDGLMLAGGGGGSHVREFGAWWTSTLLNGSLIHAGHAALSKDDEKLNHSSNFRECGIHVRCIED